MEIKLKPDEQKCIRMLARMALKGEVTLVKPEVMPLLQSEGISVDDAGYNAIMQTMEHIGAIGEVTHSFGEDGRFAMFVIQAQSTLYARQLDEQEEERKKPGDIVEQIKDKARQNPFLATVIIAFAVLTLAVTFANQFISLLEKLGWIATQK